MRRRRTRGDFPFPIHKRPPVPEYGDEDAITEEPDPGVDSEEPIPDPKSAPPSDDWWTHPYKGGPMVKVPGFPRALYPPDAKKQGRTPSKDGPDVVAYKRTVSRMGRWKPWDPSSWDDSFNNQFSHGRGTGMVGDSGIEGIQRQQWPNDPKMETGWVGEKTFNLMRSARVPTGPHAGEMAMDGVAVNLIEQAWQIAHAPKADIEDVKDAIYDYLEGCIDKAGIWHYSQNRAMTHLGREPNQESTCDCSGHSTGAYYMGKKKTGIAVPDPNGSSYSYNGYGYTGTLINNPQVKSPYQVGDLAIYGSSMGNTSHVCTCMIEGNANESVWCSMGSEEAPYAVELHYRGDLLCVVRPGLMP